MASPHNLNAWHRVQRVVAALLSWPMLRPTVSRGGADGLAYEAARLRTLAAKGAPVPEVLDMDPAGPWGGWIAVSDLGPTLQALFEDVTEPDGRAEMLTRAAHALARLHALGEWHGSGQVRDMVLTDGDDIGFIDFEEDLSAVMPVAEAQARDLLMFLTSAARYVDRAGLTAALAAYRTDAPEAPWPHVARATRWLSLAARPLRPFGRKLGRDARQALAVAEALKNISACASR